MFSLIIVYIKHQSLQFKILLFISIVLFFVASAYMVKYSYSNHILVESQKIEISNYKDQLEELKKAKTKTIRKAKTKNKETKVKADIIDTKLKEDEKSINNNISDKQLQDYISKHQK